MNIKEIFEQLNVVGGLPCDAEFIALTISKLPEDIQKKVINESFVVMDCLFGNVNLYETSFHKKDFEEYDEIRIPLTFIFLNFTYMRFEKLHVDKIMTVIVHEIGHFILKHHYDEKNPSKKEQIKREKDVIKLIKEWGFDDDEYHYDMFDKIEKMEKEYRKSINKMVIK